MPRPPQVRFPCIAIMTLPLLAHSRGKPRGNIGEAGTRSDRLCLPCQLCRRGVRSCCFAVSAAVVAECPCEAVSDMHTGEEEPAADQAARVRLQLQTGELALPSLADFEVRFMRS